MSIPERARRRRLWFAVTAAIAVAVTGAVLMAAALWPRGGTPISEDEALHAFRAGDVLSKFGPAPLAGDAAAAPTPTSPVPAGEETLAALPAGDPEAGADAGAVAAGPGAAATAPGRPAAGVYSFAASGTESVAIGPASQTRTLAETVTATVRPDGTCWTFTHDIFVEHVETTRYCPGDGGSLRMTGHSKSQKIGVVTAQAEMSCTPPDVLGPATAVTARWTAACTLRTRTPVFTAEVTEAGTTTVSGPETVSVGGAGVAAWHVQFRRSASGDFSGHWNEDIWFSTADHTIVRITRDADMVGPARFTETSAFTLRSLRPRS